MVAAEVKMNSRTSLLLVYKGGCYDIVTSRKVPFVLDLAGLPDHACCKELLNKSSIYTSYIF